MQRSRSQRIVLSLCTLMVANLVPASAIDACTRTLYVGADGTVITGRNMDWEEDMGSNLWILPAGMARDGAAGPRSMHWILISLFC
jgi:penicillin V acylase-like amidase (Ntn superfamily)